MYIQNIYIIKILYKYLQKHMHIQYRSFSALDVLDAHPFVATAHYNLPRGWLLLVPVVSLRSVEMWGCGDGEAWEISLHYVGSFERVSGHNYMCWIYDIT